MPEVSSRIEDGSLSDLARDRAWPRQRTRGKTSRRAANERTDRSRKSVVQSRESCPNCTTVSRLPRRLRQPIFFPRLKARGCAGRWADEVNGTRSASCGTASRLLAEIIGGADV